MNMQRRTTHTINECQAEVISKWLSSVDLSEICVRYKSMVTLHIQHLPDPKLFNEGEFDDIFYTMKMFEELNDLKNR